MANVILYGGLSVLPLVLGGIFGSYLNLKEKTIGIISALGAGAMIAALALGLMEESFRLGGFDQSILGFLIGALIFILGDLLIIHAGGRGHKRYYNAKKTTGFGILLGTILDGIPEAIALGASLLINPKLGFLVLVSIILNNLPESLSSAYDLKKANKKPSTIFQLWIAVSLIIFLFVILGYSVFSTLSGEATAVIQSIAAGAILAMVASTLMPEAYQESGLDASLATVAGFLLIFILSKIGA